MKLIERDFESQIEYFNKMYKLPMPAYPTAEDEAKHERDRLDTLTVGINKIISNKVEIISRLSSFKHILDEELFEVEDIILSLQTGYQHKGGESTDVSYTELEFLTDLADWLGDIQVYCASEMLRYGLPNKEILSIIMASNFSKLGEDGQPIYDDRGKVKKGPNYWKPEPLIKSLLENRIQEFLAENKDAENKESKE